MSCLKVTNVGVCTKDLRLVPIKTHAMNKHRITAPADAPAMISVRWKKVARPAEYYKAD